MKTNNLQENWIVFIGLEIHVQLKTRLKLFSPAKNNFGDEPNTNIHTCCMGLPGSLPMLSSEPVHNAIKLGLALNSTISMNSTFDRKFYFYPDSPRNFQITQFHNPIISGGHVLINTEEGAFSVRIKEAHIEDDTALMKHLPGLTAIDFNRAGVPLIEIVTFPDIRSAQKAVLFVTAIKQILEYLEVSDCDMENGNLRIDVNVSISKDENHLNNKCEIKNLNSLNIMAKAIQQEVYRQEQLYNQGLQDIESATYKWDGEDKRLKKMRKKNTLCQYMYFREPDLLTVTVTDDMIQAAKQNMPEMPSDRFNRYNKHYGLDFMASQFLISNRLLSDFFDEIVQKTNSPQLTFNLMCSELIGRLDCPIYSSNITKEHVIDLVKLVGDKLVSTKNSKDIVTIMLQTNEMPSKILANHPEFKMDTQDFTPLIESVIKENMQSVQDYKNGKKRAFDFIVGKVLSKAKNAQPSDIREKALLLINKF